MTDQQRHLLRVGLLSALLLALAWRVLSLGMADHLARKSPERALGWRASHPVALVGSSEHMLAGGQQAALAERRALDALRSNPLEGRAYRVLGQLAEKAGNQTRAVELYELAATRSPRDLKTHAWLQENYIRKGEVAPALHHTDLLLRVEPQTRDRQFPILVALAGLPPAQSALAELMWRRPPWREAFLTFLSRQAPDSAAVAPFMSQVLAGKGGMSRRELSSWIERLGRDRRWDEAYVTWAGALPAEQQKQLSNVFNGGFEREQSDSGFDWRITSVPGAYVERLPTPGATGEFALLVGFEDRRVPFHHVRQLLALPPGLYRLEARARADGLRTERGLVWNIICAPAGGDLGSTEAIKGHSPWRTLTVDFTVPEQGCGAQWLRLVLPARIAAEQRIGGRAWFDDLRIVRRQGPAS